MATLKDYAGVLPHHLKLIADSDIHPQRLQELHSSGLFSMLLQCRVPNAVNKKAAAELFGVPDERSIETLREIVRRKISQAARIRDEAEKRGAWHAAMTEAGNALRAWYRKLENTSKENERAEKSWEEWNEKYYNEAAALVLYWVYSTTVRPHEKSKEKVCERMRERVPCDICYFSGALNGVDCGACDGRGTIEVKQIICPKCKGDDIGEAYADTLGGQGICGYCDAGKLLIDKLGRRADLDYLNHAHIPSPIPFI